MSRKLYYVYTSVLLGLAMTVAGVTPAFADDGSLDLTFGNNGTVITDFGSTDAGNAVVLQQDGKIVMAGISHNGNDTDFALVRYQNDGSLDPTFGVDGKVSTDFGNNRFDYGYAVTLQPDGKILMTGESNISGNASDFGVVRYNVDGSLDNTFGTNGMVITDIGSTDHSSAILVQQDSRIVVAGYSWNGSNYDFALARYNTDGSLDLSFDLDGKVTSDFGGVDLGTAMVLQPDHKLVVAGTHQDGNIGSDFVLARYNPDGTLDPTFGTEGSVITNFGSGEQYGDYGYAVDLQRDGKIVMAGSSEFSFALARFNTDGLLDATFDADGKVITDFGPDRAPFEKHSAFAVVIQTDGKIIATGTSNSDFALARYNSDGSLDNGFDVDGRVTTDFGGADFSYDVAIQPDGKIIAAGSKDVDFAIARYDVESSAIALSIDIKPQSQINHVNPRSSGRIKVAILSTPDLDALTMIDRNTVRFGRTGTEESLLRCKKRGRDVNKDGLRDLVCVFSIPLTGFQKGDPVGILSAQTVDGIALTGTDSIQVGQEGQDE